MCRRPAVSIITYVACIFPASSSPFLHISFTSVLSSIVNDATFTCSASTFSCFFAAGLYTSAPIRSGVSPFERRCLASFPAKVVFPAPCNPESIIIVGFLGDFAICTFVPPRTSTSSSCTIFTNCCVGFTPDITSSPKAFSLIFETKFFATP